MIIIPDPQTKKLVQTNTSDILGNIWTSFNIDLTEQEGKIRVGKRMLINTNSDDVSGFTSAPIGYRYFTVSGNNRIYKVAGGTVYYAGATASVHGNFIKDVSSGVPTNCDANSDIEVFNGSLYVTGGASLYKLDSSGTWSTNGTSMNSGVPHMMSAYGSRLYITDLLSNIVSLNTSDILNVTMGTQYTLQLTIASNPGSIITSIRSAANKLWLTTVNTTGGKGYVYTWDGSSNQATAGYRLHASGALACVIKDDIPWIVDSNANLMAYNGGTFQKITRLNRQKNKLLKSATLSSNTRFIHPNGMSVIRDRVCMLINNQNDDNASSIEETIPSGIWEYDPDRGLIHKYGIGLAHDTDTITDFGQNRLVSVGALSEMNLSSTSSTRNGTFLAGVGYKTDNSTTKYATLFDDVNDTLQKAGYFITTKILSSNVTDVWQSIYIKYRKFLSQSDKIVVKYRTVEQEPTEMIITWASTTSFTTTDSNMANYAIGDEVEITQGLGSGKCSHITNIVNNSGTYTVTVDETYTSASNKTALARLNQWTKMPVSGVSLVKNYDNFQFKLTATSTWVQLKVWMLFTGREEVEEFQLQNKVSQDAK